MSHPFNDCNLSMILGLAIETRVRLPYGYELLQAEAVREQEYLAFVDKMRQSLQLKTVRPFYRQLHPSRNLETIPGVG